MPHSGFFQPEGMELDKMAAIASVIIGMAELAVLSGIHEQKYSPVPGKDYSHVETIAKITTLASLVITLYNVWSAWNIQQKNPTPVRQWLFRANLAFLVGVVIETVVLLLHSDELEQWQKSEQRGGLTDSL